MSIKQSLEKRLIKFGKNNSPTLVAMSIATAKGICRPTFTMMDKKENYETKKYTALREGLTELVAIPVYYFSGVVSKKISEKLAVPKHFMPKDIYKKSKSGDMSQEVKSAVEHAESLAKINLPKISTATAFIGVCVSALFLIPFICSATIKPIMKLFDKKNAPKKENPLPGHANSVKKINNLRTFNGLYNYSNTGSMKVGGL